MLLILAILFCYFVYAAHRYANIIPLSNLNIRLPSFFSKNKNPADLPLDTIISAIESLLRKGRFIQAKSLIQNHLLQNNQPKTKSQGYFLLAKCYLNAQLHTDAITHLELAIKQDENLEAVKLLLSLLSLQQSWDEQSRLCSRYNFDPSIQSYAFHAAILANETLPTYLDTIYQYHPMSSKSNIETSLQYWPVQSLTHLQPNLSQVASLLKSQPQSIFRLIAMCEQINSNPSDAYTLLNRDNTLLPYAPRDSVNNLILFADSFLKLYQSTQTLFCSNCQTKHFHYQPHCSHCGSCETFLEIQISSH